MKLKEFAKVTSQTVQEALEMARECDALYTEYAEIMVDADNKELLKKLDETIIEELKIIG